MVYRAYVTDSLQMICKNVAPAGYGTYPSTRWYDAIQPKKRETRTGEQIVADVIKKAGLKVVSKDGST